MSRVFKDSKGPDRREDVRHYILCSSLLIIKEKQQFMRGRPDGSSGFLSEQAVRRVSWAGSNAIVPNSSQYRTTDSSVRISCNAILPCIILIEEVRMMNCVTLDVLCACFFLAFFSPSLPRTFSSPLFVNSSCTWFQGKNLHRVISRRGR